MVEGSKIYGKTKKELFSKVFCTEFSLLQVPVSADKHVPFILVGRTSFISELYPLLTERKGKT